MAHTVFAITSMGPGPKYARTYGVRLIGADGETIIPVATEKHQDRLLRRLERALRDFECAA
jgi:hypothetical protein